MAVTETTNIRGSTLVHGLIDVLMTNYNTRYIQHHQLISVTGCYAFNQLYSKV